MSWKTIYLNYDENALILFANVGVLRRARKDVDGKNVKLIEDSHTVCTFESDGKIVKLTAQGIQSAECSCQATGCCKHILSSVLWLQENQNSDKTQDVTSESSESEDIIKEVLTLQPIKLMKQVGIAQVRMAYQLFLSWLEESSFQIEISSAQIKLRVPELTEPLLYLKGAGYEGMISSAPEKQKKAYHLAALALLFEQNEQKWSWNESVTLVDKQNLDKLDSDELALINQVQSMIAELLNQGLSHLSRNVTIQLHMLNMTARTQGLPILSTMLRNLSKQVSLLVDEHFSVDERQVLLSLAQMEAYTESLKAAQGTMLKDLRGQRRRGYELQNETLSLIPLGAYWWSRKTGALGITLYFWDRVSKQYLESTNARPNSMDTSFYRESVWTTSFWKSQTEKLMQAPFTLHHPRLSDDGRLAFGGQSYAKTEQVLSLDDYNQLQKTLGFTNWSVLQHSLLEANSRTEGVPPIVVLHIESYEKPYFDEVEQCLVWKVKDAQQNQLFFHLPLDENRSTRIDHLEQFLHSGAKILAIIASTSRQGYSIQLQPFSLWYQDSKSTHIQMIHLDFGHIRRVKIKHSFFSRIKEFLKKREELNYVQTLQYTSNLNALLIHPILDLLELYACSKQNSLGEHQTIELKELVQKCHQLGLSQIADQLNQLAKKQDLLKIVYLCDLLQKLECTLPIVINSDKP